jgi:hypothetical protein
LWGEEHLEAYDVPVEPAGKAAAEEEAPGQVDEEGGEAACPEEGQEEAARAPGEPARHLDLDNLIDLRLGWNLG